MRQKLIIKIKFPGYLLLAILLITSLFQDCKKDDEEEIFVPTLYMHGMAQTGGNGVISFGGINFNKMDNLAYCYNPGPNEWELINVTEKPHARSQFGMCYGGNNKIVIFGGWYSDEFSNYQSGYVMYNDTWEFDLSNKTWENIEVEGGIPEKRRWTAMAYAGNSKVVLFGGDLFYTSAGTDINTYLSNDTWIYDVTLNTWEHVLTENAPGKRAYHSMAYAGENKVLLYGGSFWETVTPFNYSGTWEFDVVTKEWTEIEINGDYPAGRNLAALSFAGDNTIVLFGGNLKADGNGYTNETWEYNILSKTWAKININDPVPKETIHHKMAYGGNNKVYLHGGVGTPSTGSVWEYDRIAKTWKELLRQTGM